MHAYCGSVVVHSNVSGRGIVDDPVRRREERGNGEKSGAESECSAGRRRVGEGDNLDHIMLNRVVTHTKQHITTLTHITG